MQNPASTEDVRKIADLINRIDFDGTHLLALKDTFPDKVYLGEINPQYYAFLAALKAQCDYLQQKERISRRALNGKRRLSEKRRTRRKLQKIEWMLPGNGLNVMSLLISRK